MQPISSFHFYAPVDDDLDNLLLDVYDAYYDLGVDDRAQDHFFIFYEDERGPHIRFRVIWKDPKQKQEENAIMDAMLVFINNISENPIEVALVPYEPEFDRYGGDLGLSTSIKIFSASSQMVDQLYRSERIEEILEQDEEISDTFYLELAKNFALFVLKHSGLSEKQQAEIALAEAHRWSGFLLETEDEKPVDDAKWEVFLEEYLSMPKDEDIDAFRFLYDDVAEIIDSTEHGDFNHILIDTLRKNIKSGAIVRAPAYIIGTLPPQISVTEKMYASFLCDFIHLNNNRLGLANHLETVVSLMVWQDLHGTIEEA